MLWLLTLATGGNFGPLNSPLSMKFVKNVGQYSPEVAFGTIHPSIIAVYEDGSIRIGKAILHFDSKPQQIIGTLKLNTKVSYFSNERSVGNIPTYSQIILQELYPNIDALLTATGKGQIEIQFVVKPGGNPDNIRMIVQGGDIEQADDKIVVNDILTISHLKAFQGSEEISIAPIIEQNTISFRVDGYDSDQTLIIDPITTAILAGSDDDRINNMAISNDGYILATGYTRSSDFAPDRNYNGPGSTAGTKDIFVSKIATDLRTHIATAIIAGSSDEAGMEVTTDLDGNVFVAGWTASSDVPSNTTYGTRGDKDAIVVKLSSDLQDLTKSVIVASSERDVATSIVVDGNGNVYLGGKTGDSDNFTGTADTTFYGTKGKTDAFISKFTSALKHKKTLFLGNGTDNKTVIRDMIITPDNKLVATGQVIGTFTFADTIFGDPGTPDTTNNVFVSRFRLRLIHRGTVVIASPGNDDAKAITLDTAGNILIAGVTNHATSFSQSPKYTFGALGGQDAFVTKLSSDLSTHIATAIIGGSGDDLARDVKVTPTGKVLVGGYTYNPTDFASPNTTYGATGGKEAFVTRLSSNLSTHVHTYFFTSSGDDDLYALEIKTTSPSPGINATEEFLAAGATTSASDFSTTSDTLGTSGAEDGFIISDETLLPVEFSEGDKLPAVMLKGQILEIHLNEASYLGYDIFDPAGRLIHRESLGFYPAGSYSFTLPKYRGVHILKLRIGNRIETYYLIR